MLLRLYHVEKEADEDDREDLEEHLFSLWVMYEHIGDLVHVNEERHLAYDGHDDAKPGQDLSIMPGKAHFIRSNHVANKRTTGILEPSAEHEQSRADQCANALHCLVFHAEQASNDCDQLQGPAFRAKHNQARNVDVPKISLLRFIVSTQPILTEGDVKGGSNFAFKHAEAEDHDEFDQA